MRFFLAPLSTSQLQNKWWDEHSSKVWRIDQFQASKTGTSQNIFLGLRIKGWFPFPTTKKSFRKTVAHCYLLSAWWLLHQFALELCVPLSKDSCMAVGAWVCWQWIHRCGLSLNSFQIFCLTRLQSAAGERCVSCCLSNENISAASWKRVSN